jgi:hypothetical protein
MSSLVISHFLFIMGLENIGHLVCPSQMGREINILVLNSHMMGLFIKIVDSREDQLPVSGYKKYT